MKRRRSDNLGEKFCLVAESHPVHPCLVVQNSLWRSQQLSTREIVLGDTRSLGDQEQLETREAEGRPRKNHRGLISHTDLAEMSSTTVLFSPSSSLYLAKPSPITKGRTAVAAVRCSKGPALSVTNEEGQGGGVAMVGRRRALASAAAAVCGASVLGLPGLRPLRGCWQGGFQAWLNLRKMVSSSSSSFICVVEVGLFVSEL